MPISEHSNERMNQTGLNRKSIIGILIFRLLLNWRNLKKMEWKSLDKCFAPGFYHGGFGFGKSYTHIYSRHKDECVAMHVSSTYIIWDLYRLNNFIHRCFLYGRTLGPSLQVENIPLASKVWLDLLVYYFFELLLVLCFKLFKIMFHLYQRMQSIK